MTLDELRQRYPDFGGPGYFVFCAACGYHWGGSLWSTAVPSSSRAAWLKWRWAGVQ